MLKCPECGQVVEHAKFCAECGHHFDAVDETNESNSIESEATGVEPDSASTTSMPASTTAPTGASSGRRGLLIGAAVLVLVVIIGVGVYLLASSSRDSDATDYREKIAKLMGPVLGANDALTQELDDLDDADADDAKSAVQDLKREVTRAEGAIDALDTPDIEDLDEVRDSALDVLRREARFVDAVEEVLTNPASSKTDDLADLEGDLVDALDAAGPAIAGDEDVVDGADDLEEWAVALVKSRAKTAADKQRKAEVAKRRREAELATARAAGAAAAAGGSYGVPVAGGTDCGTGVWAGSDTTCPFAEVVRTAYNYAPTTVATVDAYSPVTRRTYTMNCRPAGNGWILCTGGNNASVWF